MVDPSSVSNLAELRALSSEDRVQLGRLYPELVAELAGAPARPLPPLSDEEAKAREAGLAALAKADSKRLAGVRSASDFLKLPVRLQQRLHREEPARAAALSADLRRSVAAGRRP